MNENLLNFLSRFSDHLDCRSSSKPPMGKSNKKDKRKRTYDEDDELDPMDPSSYSDAPRGGWYVFWGSVLLAVYCLFFRYVVSHFTDLRSSEVIN